MTASVSLLRAGEAVVQLGLPATALRRFSEDNPWTESLPDASSRADGRPRPAPEVDCGWTTGRVASPLVDPLRWDCDDGAATAVLDPTELGWWIDTTSVSVVRLAGGTWRMFMQGPTLSRVVPETGTPRRFPFEGPEGVGKYAAKDCVGDEPFQQDLNGEAHAWWEMNNGPDAADLRFSDQFIAYLDSTDPRAFPVYVPMVDGAPDCSANACRFVGLGAHFDGVFGAFKAGWTPTFVRCRGDYVVYRDVTVLVLPGSGVHVMFAVACWDPLRRTRHHADADICSMDGQSGATPHTNLVYFLSASGTFREDLRGPYQAMSATPAQGQGQWLGVPAAFTDPAGQFLFVYIPGALSVDGGLNPGMYAARMADFEDSMRDQAVWVAPVARSIEVPGQLRDPNVVSEDVVGPRPDFSTGPFDVRRQGDPLGGQAAFLDVFVYLGAVTLTGETPGHEELAPIDEEFAFCPSGELAMFFANRSTGDKDDRPDVITKALSGSGFVFQLVLGRFGQLRRLQDVFADWLDEQTPGPMPVGANPLGSNAPLRAALLDFIPDCNVVDTSDAGFEVNDPEVILADGEMLVHYHASHVPGLGEAGALLVAESDDAGPC